VQNQHRQVTRTTTSGRISTQSWIASIAINTSTFAL
jgi:hypothetical protein